MVNMKNKQNNYAFIDSQNLNLGVRAEGWVLDFARFRVYLKDKYGVKRAFLFIGYVSGNESLYQSLQEAGYTVILKPTLTIRKNGKEVVKGNCDAELVLHTMIEWSNYDKALIVSGDGDFHCLIEHLEKHEKLAHVIIPNRKHHSALLRKFRKYFVFMNPLKKKLQKHKERE